MIEVPLAKFNLILSRLADPEMVELSEFDLLVYARGWQSKYFYYKLEKNSGIEVMWTGWGGPRWTSLFSFFPCQAALLRITDPSRMKVLYEELAASSVTDIFYVRKNITPLLKEKISVRDRNFATLLADELSVRPSDAMYDLLERASEVVTPS